MNKIPNALIFLFFVNFLLMSCKKDINLNDQDDNDFYQKINGTQPYDSTFVPLLLAQDIAKQMTYEYFTTGNSNYLGNRQLANTLTIKDEDSIPTLYIINYPADSGFVVIAANINSNPVLAISRKGNLNSGDEIPPFLEEWLLYKSETVSLKRGLQFDSSSFKSVLEWETLVLHLDLPNKPALFQRAIDEVLDGGGVPCSDPIVVKSTVAPLLATTWGQGATYNNLVPKLCSGDPTGRAPAGCVPVAMAQLIRYWQTTPTFTTYNYASMPNFSGNSEVQRLLVDCGSKAGTSYGCSGSGTFSSSARFALATYFGFERGVYYSSTGLYASTAITNDYEDQSDFYNIRNSINIGQPVYLDGCRSRTDFGLFIVPYNCHAWLTDGFLIRGNSCMNTSLMLHMNWGWDGPRNGLFDWDLWQPNPIGTPDRIYQFDQNYSTNIHP